MLPDHLSYSTSGITYTHAHAHTHTHTYAKRKGGREVHNKDRDSSIVREEGRREGERERESHSYAVLPTSWYTGHVLPNYAVVTAAIFGKI